MKTKTRLQNPKSQWDGNLSPSAKENPKLAHFTQIYGRDKQCSSSTNGGSSPCGSAGDRYGRTLEIMAADHFFACMMFLVLATHGTFGAFCMAGSYPFTAVGIAAASSWFWSRAWTRGKLAARLHHAASLH